MGKKLTPGQKQFFKKIDTILWEQWDPIGVNDMVEARDEYESYVPTIFSSALKGSEKDISEKLIHIEKISMGLNGNPENCSKIASLIFREKAELSL